MKITVFKNRWAWLVEKLWESSYTNGTLFQTFSAFLELQKFQWVIFAPRKSYFTEKSRWVPLAHFESLPRDPFYLRATHLIGSARSPYSAKC